MLQSPQKAVMARNRKRVTLSIVVPAYNEAQIIDASLQSLHEFLADHRLLHSTEIIVVTASGGDDTPHRVARYADTFPHFVHVQPGPKKGKGRDVRAGVQIARGDYVLFTDADLATPLHHIPQTLELLTTHDVVIGVRDLSTLHQGIRYYLSNMANVLIRLVLLPGYRDTQCGYKAFTASARTLLFDRVTIDGWGFDMEVLKIAVDHQLNVAQQPISDWSDPKIEDSLSGESTMRAAINTLKELWYIRRNAWLKKYQ